MRGNQWRIFQALLRSPALFVAFGGQHMKPVNLLQTSLLHEEHTCLSNSADGGPKHSVGLRGIVNVQTDLSQTCGATTQLEAPGWALRGLPSPVKPCQQPKW